jgi:hypothetical protein
MPSLPITPKERIAKLSILAAVTAASLWDYRLFNLRIFDGAALVLLGLWFVLTPEPIIGFLQRRRRYWVLFLTVIVYAAVGFILHQHKSSLAIIALASIGLILAGRKEWLMTIGPFLWTLICIHIVFFIVQFGVYYSFGHIIDFQALLGGKSRLIVYEDHMRAAGLFQEPNSYCLNLFVLTTIAILWRGNRALTIVAAITLILSESLWGLGTALVLIFIEELRRQHDWRHLILTVTASFIFVGTVFYGYIWYYKNPITNVPFFYFRIKSIMHGDGSLEERYIKSTCSRPLQIEKKKIAPQTHLLPTLLGEGLSTIYFEQCLPANGISFLFKSFGILGLILLVAGATISLGGLPASAALYVVLAIGFAFTSYPLVTYVLFWLWIPALFGLMRLRALKPHPDDSASPKANY